LSVEALEFLLTLQYRQRTLEATYAMR
jgi:hypothetical protein